jgi:hypothetical protein
MARKFRGQKMTADKLRQIQELRRSSAASGKMDRTTRRERKRRAIAEGE